ncbi:MAG: hypothetical protein LBU70_00730 [Chitinispirillales bacterium]|nr:hypothetical protein [Chitinispirillales bacterium]
MTNMMEEKYAMTKHIVIFALSAVVVFMSGCTAIMTTMTTNYAPHIESAMETARERAFFDMRCGDVSGKLLGGVISPAEGIVEMVIGVAGCDKRAAYLIRCESSASWGRRIECTSRLDAVSE